MPDPTPTPTPPQNTTEQELQNSLNELRDLLNRLENELLTQQQRNEIKAQIAALIALIRFLFPGFPAFQPV